MSHRDSYKNQKKWRWSVFLDVFSNFKLLLLCNTKLKKKEIIKEC